jgi:pimeloyl-ACP methyl ester carboxylesterase
LIDMAGEGSHRGGSGEPLVLVHGFTGTWRDWKPVLPALEKHYDVLAVGLAGHYDCTPFPQGVEPTIGALVDALERDMDAVGFETAHLAGNSLGGWLALELARRGRARSVVAISPAGGWESGSKEERRIVKTFRQAHKMTSWLGPRAEWLARHKLGRWFMLRTVMAKPSRIDPEEAVYGTRAFVECPIFFELLEVAERDGPPRDFEGVDCPVLLAWAGKDRTLPLKRYSQRFREMLPEAEFELLPKVGHVPMSDDPDLVARTILDFVARNSGRLASAPTD